MDPLQFVSAARLLLVAGKGGVGKTTVTAALARAAADAGMTVLTVEVDDKPALAGLLPGLPVQTVTAARALSEYLQEHGFGRVVRRLTSSGVVDVVATAAPGIDDIVVLGKLKQIERSGVYDLVVVDGPAAGHAITMLRAPGALLGAVRSGPIHDQARAVAEMLGDGVRSQVLLVTAPETTPVNEVVETAYELEENVGVTLAGVVVNGVDHGDDVPEIVSGARGDDVVAAARFRNARRRLQRLEIDRLAHELPLPQLHLPYVSTAHIQPADVEALARVLSAGVAGSVA